MLIGVGRPGLDAQQHYAFETEEFWGVSSHNGTLAHANQFTHWDGQQRFVQGDTVGLLLDAGPAASWSTRTAHD